MQFSVPRHVATMTGVADGSSCDKRFRATAAVTRGLLATLRRSYSRIMQA